MDRRARTGGFSIVEAMIAAIVLGIGLLGLVELHRTSIRGTVQAISAGQALEIARTVVETVQAADYVNNPVGAPAIPNACAVPAAGLQGCKLTQNTLAAPRGALCTFYADEAPVTTGNNDSPFEPGTPPTTPVDGRFRIDTAFHPHPNAVQYPAAQMVTVWVCWQDAGGVVNEVTASRVLTQDF